MGEKSIRRTSPAALASPELLSAIVDTTGALIVALDRQGRIVLFNRACERLTGYRFEEVEGTYVWDRLLVAEEIDSVKAVFTDLRAGKFPNEHENYWLTKDGRRRWVHWNNTALVGGDGLVECVLGTGIDITERRQAEEAARQLAVMVESAADAIFSVALDGTILTWNRGAERMYGYAPQEAVGRPISLIFPDGLDDTVEVVERVKRGERVERFEVPRVCKDGRTIYVSLTMAPMRNASGEVIATSRTARDVTADKEMRAALEEAHQRSAAILDTAVDGIITIDEQGCIQSANKAAERIFGYPESEIIGKNVSVLMPPPYGAKHDDYLRRYLQTGEKRIIGIGREVSGRRKDGTVFPVDLAVGEIHVRGRRLFTGVLRDITQRKRTQSALMESERKFRSLIETAGSAIVVLAPNHRVLEWNDEAERIYGYKRDEILGKDYFAHFLPPEVRDAVATDIEEVLRGKRTMGFENAIVSRDGRRHDMLWNVSRVVDAEGRPTGVMAIGQDVTERKRLEQEAQRRLHELAHVSRSQSISEVASGLAHEINQPLTAIISYAEACRLILGRDEVDAELLRRSLVDIVKQGERASEIINRLRDFVRRDQIAREPVDLNALVRGALELLRHELAVHGVQVQLALEERLRPVRASRVQIEQVLFNLVRNAIDAMSASAVRELEIHTAMMRGENPALAVAVSDTGEGLAPDTLESLFDPFFSTKPGGMGLGLSISRSIVEAHGGRIWAVAREDGGTTFRFTLPFEEAPAR